MMEIRIIFATEADQKDAERVLDANYCDYDYDNGGRMMVNNEGLYYLNHTSTIDFDVV